MRGIGQAHRPEDLPRCPLAFQPVNSPFCAREEGGDSDIGFMTSHTLLVAIGHHANMPAEWVGASILTRNRRGGQHTQRTTSLAVLIHFLGVQAAYFFRIYTKTEDSCIILVLQPSVKRFQ